MVEQCYRCFTSKSLQRVFPQWIGHSRAIRGKYLQCSYGVFPLSFFFSGSAKNDAAGDSTVSTVSLKEQLREMIGKDPGLSDRVLAEKLR